MKYLEKQFPSDYPEDEEEKKKKAPKPLTEKELAEKKKKEMEDYSKNVLQEATAYNAKLDKEAKDAEEQKKQADQNLDMVEEALVQLKDPKISLAQTSNNEFLMNLSKLGINLDELVQKESPED